MRTPLRIAFMVILFCFPFLAFAQPTDIPYHIESYNWKSQQHDGNSSSIRLAEKHVVRAPSAPWVRLIFGDVNLGSESRITIISLHDGARQDLNTRTLREWQNTSAYFNGDAVEVQIHVGGGDRDVFIEIADVMVGDWVSGVPQPLSQCGPTDDRVPSNDPAVGRIVNIGCTGWIVSNGLHVTAGHCSGNLAQVLEFNVPPSNPDGTINHPGPEDQYSIDPNSKIFVNGGIGNDWGVFGVFNNSQTGLQPIDAQGASFNVVQNLGPANIRITGFGVDFDDPTLSQTQQTHVGPNAGSSGTTMRYQTDTEGGNSGSPVIDDATGNAVGVHTHGGCTTVGTGNNSGTSTFNTAFWAALNPSPPGLDVTLTPINPPIVIPPGGGSFSYTLRIENTGSSSITFQTWNLFTLPNGKQFGPTLGPFNPTFAPGQVFSRTLTQNVPAGARPGTYTYHWQAGTAFPNADLDEDSFPFTKSTAPTVASTSNNVDSDWVLRDAETGQVLDAAALAALIMSELNDQVVANLPTEFAVEQNYPNPFNPSTVIRYQLPKEADVSIKVFDLLGKEVVTLIQERQAAGYKSVTWSGTNAHGQPVPAGIYLYRVQVDGQVSVKKMILTK